MDQRDSAILAVASLGIVWLVAHGYLTYLWSELYNLAHGTGSINPLTGKSQANVSSSGGNFFSLQGTPVNPTETGAKSGGGEPFVFGPAAGSAPWAQTSITTWSGGIGYTLTGSYKGSTFVPADTRFPQFVPVRGQIPQNLISLAHSLLGSL